jgi:hypothetical protein
MTNTTIDALTPHALPLVGNEQIELDDAADSTKLRLRDIGLYNTGVTWNPDGTIHTKTENGRTWTFTNRPDGLPASKTDGTVTVTFNYDLVSDLPTGRTIT